MANRVSPTPIDMERKSSLAWEQGDDEPTDNVKKRPSALRQTTRYTWFSSSLFCARETKDGKDGKVLRRFLPILTAYSDNFNTLYLLHYFAMVFFIAGCAAIMSYQDIAVTLHTDPTTTTSSTDYYKALNMSNEFAQLIFVVCLEIVFLMPIAVFHHRAKFRYKKFEPFSEEELLKAMFSHFPDFSFMISYCWRDDTLPEGDKHRMLGRIPRKIASWFDEICWIDIKKLIPGTQLHSAIVEACNDARFRLAFVSKAYFSSANCLVEWEIIDKEPANCIVFAYPCVTTAQLADMREAGHTVYEIVDIEKELMRNSRWLLDALLSTRKATHLFRTSTPPMNEPRWYATTRILNPSPGKYWIRQTLPLISLYSIYIALLMLLFAGIPIHNGRITFFFQSFLLFFAMLAPFGGFVSMVYYSWFFYYAGGNPRENLPNVCHLLYLLRALKIINPVPVYASDPTHLDPHYLTLVKDDIITLETDPAKAKLKIINAEQEMLELGPNDIVYSGVRFNDLKQEVRDTLGSYIIGEKDESTSVELIAIKVLMCNFECTSTNALTKGSCDFSQLKLGSMKKKSILSSAFSVMVHAGDDISKGVNRASKGLGFQKKKSTKFTV